MAITQRVDAPVDGVPVDGVAVGGLLRTHWMLASCAACGHERVHGEQHHALCPACGTVLHSFRLYRELTAGQEDR